MKHAYSLALLVNIIILISLSISELTGEMESFMCRLQGLHGRIFTYPEQAEIQLPFSDFVNISKGSMAHFLSRGKISPNSQVTQSTFKEAARCEGYSSRQGAEMGYPGGSAVKNLPTSVGDMGLIPGSGRPPWRKKWQPPPVFLPGKSHGQRSLVGSGPWGHKESDTTEVTSLARTRARHRPRGLSATSPLRDVIRLCSGSV